MNQIQERVERIQNLIGDAAVRSGRNPEDITLIAVSKTRSAEEIRKVLDAGVTHVGENRVQEALPKIDEIGNDPVWHMIGHLQSNKAKRAAEKFAWIDSVDSPKLAKILSDQARLNGADLNVLVQVNISREQSKSGASLAEVRDLTRYVHGLEGLSLRGLMTIGSLGASPEVTRAEFRTMRDMFDELRSDEIVGSCIMELSMGMSGDFEIAVEEGSTMVRIGTALFGGRR